MVKRKRYIVLGILLVLAVGSIGLFHFFTTGYPVQGKQEQEVQAIIEKALRSCQCQGL